MCTTTISPQRRNERQKNSKMEIRWRDSCENKNLILKVGTLTFNSKSKQSSQPAKERKKERKKGTEQFPRERENI